MTARKYRSAMGKTVDIGALMLQNENVRAVGNMGVNARGDTLDSNNQVIDRKAQQIQRHNQKTNVMNEPMLRKRTEVQQEMPVDPADTFNDMPEDDVIEPAPVVETAPIPQGGLAAAIAKAKTVQQEKIVPPKQAAKTASGVRKL